MQNDLYRLDDDKIRQLLKERGWKPPRLQIESGLSRRTITYILKERRPVTFETAKMVAQALRVPLAKLRPMLAQSPHWQSVPELAGETLSGYQKKMKEAAEADMQGEHEKAVATTRAILTQLKPVEDAEAYDAVFLRLLTFLDHAADRANSGNYREI